MFHAEIIAGLPINKSSIMIIDSVQNKVYIFFGGYKNGIFRESPRAVVGSHFLNKVSD